MADYAPNYTARYRVKYSSLGKTHSMTWRLDAGTTTFSAVATKMGLFLADMAGNFWADWTVIGADAALADSDVFLPAPAPAQPTGTVGINIATISDAAFALSFVARTIAGEKARFFLYGTSLPIAVRSGTGNDFKVLASENSGVSAGIVRLNQTSPALVGNDNQTAIWYEYANMKYNDRWVRKLRRG